MQVRTRKTLTNKSNKSSLSIKSAPNAPHTAHTLPLTPKQAAACSLPVDHLLDPEWFKALCDPTRARILACLIKCARPCTVSEIAECCIVDLSVVSRHLQVLERAEIIASVKQGRTVSYHVCTAEICANLRNLANAIETCTPQSPFCTSAANCCK